MFWRDDIEGRVRPHLALFWGGILLLIGVAGLSAFFQSFHEEAPVPIPMSEAHEHLEKWVAVSEVRFDCEQVFSFESSNGRYETTYVVMASADGSVAALARYEGSLECVPVPAGSVWGTFRPLLGTGPLGHMRRQGLQFSETGKAVLDFEPRTDGAGDDRLVSLLVGVIFLVTGIQAVRSGIRRTWPNRRGLRTVR